MVAARISAALAYASNRYRARLPDNIPRSAAVSFGISFGVDLVRGALFTPNIASVVPTAFVFGSFATVASLIDSTIRPLISLNRLGHVGHNETFFDWAGRYIIVLLLTTATLSFGLPLVGIFPSPQLIERMISFSSMWNFASQYYRPEEPPREARRYYFFPSP